MQHADDWISVKSELNTQILLLNQRSVVWISCVLVLELKATGAGHLRESDIEEELCWWSCLMQQILVSLIKCSHHIIQCYLLHQVCLYYAAKLLVYLNMALTF